jgi:toxin ParE1/3/4
LHHNHAIYYRPLADAIVIIRVLHGARDVVAIAEHGGFLG